MQATTRPQGKISIAAMNPVTLAPPRGTRFNLGLGGASSGCTDWCGRPQLSEYNDSIHKMNRREDLLLQRRLRQLDRTRDDAAARLRKSTESTRRLNESMTLRRSPSLSEYDEWRTVHRYNFYTKYGTATQSGVVSEPRKLLQSDSDCVEDARIQPQFAGPFHAITLSPDVLNHGKPTVYRHDGGVRGQMKSVITVTVKVRAKGGAKSAVKNTQKDKPLQKVTLANYVL